MSYTLNRQPHFKAQPKDQLVVWVYALISDQPGNYIKNQLQNVQVWKLHVNGYTTWVY